MYLDLLNYHPRSTYQLSFNELAGQFLTCNFSVKLKGKKGVVGGGENVATALNESNNWYRRREKGDERRY